jgi:hypothetical protein
MKEVILQMPQICCFLLSLLLSFYHSVALVGRARLVEIANYYRDVCTELVAIHLSVNVFLDGRDFCAIEVRILFWKINLNTSTFL